MTYDTVWSRLDLLSLKGALLSEQEQIVEELEGEMRIPAYFGTLAPHQSHKPLSKEKVAQAHGDVVVR